MQPRQVPRSTTSGFYFLAPFKQKKKQFLSDRVFKQRDETKSDLWRDELRRALARIQMTLHNTDEVLATLPLPW